MAQSNATISNKQFITMSVNLIHKALIEPTRTHSKNLYKSLLAGERRAITTVKMEDESTVRFDIAIDTNEYRGKLNYSMFRDGVTLLLANFVETMKAEKEPAIFRAEGEEHKMLFGVTAPTIQGEVLNVMALSAEVSPNSAEILLKLLYLPPDQFVQNADNSAGVLGA